MYKLPKLFDRAMVIAMVAVTVGTANAADPARGGAANMGRGRATMATGMRMPTMPTLPGSSIGNLSPDLPGNNQPTPPKPQPSTCPDGGVANSEYTVENCMNDVLACVNNGALPGGLNDLFNEDLRHAIMNGMGLCAPQVEKCVADVRKNCSSVYNSSSDVWLDFNSRKIQPEYYNFVLRKTGLTPNQAENTCRLLDKNTYGSSFAAVSNSGNVTSEYNNPVGAYNGQQGNVLIKNNPQGVAVNNADNTVDGARGHYARWDAATATCLLRVAAYNKDKHITNSWLFGALGDDEPAEVWRAAGDSFSCNKDLFGFSLMNKTSTAAVVGVGGGAVVGAGVGAAVGGKHKMDCGAASWRKELTQALRTSNKIGTLNEYLKSPISVTGDINEKQCLEIVEVYDMYQTLETAVSECEAANKAFQSGEEYTEVKESFGADIQAPIKQDGESDEDFAKRLAAFTAAAEEISGSLKKLATTDSTDACSQRFKTINLAIKNGTGIYCDGTKENCASATDIRSELDRLASVWNNIGIADLETGRSRGGSAAIGAGIGAGAGGVATAITAFIERNNISCHVGDGLAQVGFGKSYNIGTLKDFYVKWNLNLPDTIAPTAQVTDCASWGAACAKYTDLNQCAAAQINYKPAGSGTTTLVSSACQVSGSACIANPTISKSQGACK